ncbi:uncharacterized protein BJ212DRAFT_1303712 [Suillus subaureus]|uniref:Uncharacterized protein n=1 Tax=Suillus subaureus TaxID=48587 RepID=A0A9P7DYL1_9AGAM|nr:uncharacterized protein BJ212DRAFT_1303712 [Suillus subaureus]KAG1806195.1 hypothetical protein BJ212DRAFT_1303712 [Suillus subaureus]
MLAFYLNLNGKHFQFSVGYENHLFNRLYGSWDSDNFSDILVAHTSRPVSEGELGHSMGLTNIHHLLIIIIAGTRERLQEVIWLITSTRVAKEKMVSISPNRFRDLWALMGPQATFQSYDQAEVMEILIGRKVHTIIMLGLREDRSFFYLLPAICPKEASLTSVIILPESECIQELKAQFDKKDLSAVIWSPDLHNQGACVLLVNCQSLENTSFWTFLEGAQGSLLRIIEYQCAIANLAALNLLAHFKLNPLTMQTPLSNNLEDPLSACLNRSLHDLTMGTELILVICPTKGPHPKAWDGDEPEAQLMGAGNVEQWLLKRAYITSCQICDVCEETLQPPDNAHRISSGNSSTGSIAPSTAIQISATIISQIVNQTLVTWAITYCHQSDILRGLSLFKDIVSGEEICRLCWMLDDVPYHGMAQCKSYQEIIFANAASHR